MNALQIGLIAVGALVVALLFLWQWWQSRRSRQSSQPPVPVPVPSPSPAGANVPPAMVPEQASRVSLGSSPGKFDESNELPPTRVEPTLSDALTRVWTPRASSTTPAAHVVSAPAPDFAVVLSPPSAPQSLDGDPHEAPGFVVPEAAAAVASATSTTSATASTAPRTKLLSEWPFDERLHVHASVVSLSSGPFDAAPFVAAAGRALAWVRLFRQSPWEAFDPANVGSVQQLALALPLASRAGPIEPQDMDEWRFVLTELANTHECEAHFHGFRDGPERAAELDSFLAAVDIIPVAYLVKKDGGHWLGTRLRGTLEANGFRLQSDGRFAYHEVESDAVIFHMVDGFERPFTPERLRTENFTALRCTLEPVRLKQPLARFDMYRQSLRALAKLLDADLKTSEGDALDDGQFSATRDEVKTAMEALVNAGIEPGSETARALFY